MSVFLCCWLPQMLRPIFSDCVYDPKYPGVKLGTNNLVYLSIELPWTLTPAEESELSLSMESDACATKFSCWQGRRFFQSNINVIFPLKHKIHLIHTIYWSKLLIAYKTAAGRLKLSATRMQNARAEQSRRRRGNGWEKGRWHML